MSRETVKCCKITEIRIWHRICLVQGRPNQELAMTTFTKRFATIIAAAGLIAIPAKAAPVVTWDYVLVNEFTGATFLNTGPGDGDQNVGQLAINWGSGAGSANPRVNGDRSGLELSGTITNGLGQAQTSGSYNTNDFINPGENPTISHINNPISSAFATLNTASLFASLTLTPTNPSGPELTPIDINFNINFSETPNQAPCDANSTTPCADIFVIDASSLNTMFNYDGEDYFVSIFELTNALVPLESSVCAAAGAAYPCLGFVTQENEITDAQFGFVITTRPVSVPEPAALGLFGLGLGALALRRRKR